MPRTNRAEPKINLYLNLQSVVIAVVRNEFERFPGKKSYGQILIPEKFDSTVLTIFLDRCAQSVI